MSRFGQFYVTADIGGGRYRPTSLKSDASPGRAWAAGKPLYAARMILLTFVAYLTTYLRLR